MFGSPLYVHRDFKDIAPLRSAIATHDFLGVKCALAFTGHLGEAQCEDNGLQGHLLAGIGAICTNYALFI